MPRRPGERPCGRIINFDKVEAEFDAEMKAWFQLGAPMPHTDRDGCEDGPYARCKCRHQEAAEEMTRRLNNLRRERGSRRGHAALG